MSFNPGRLRLKYDRDSGIITCKYGAIEIPRLSGKYYGCRQHFLIEGKYFIKAENAGYKIRAHSDFTQAQNEAWFLREGVEDEDRKYFIPLIASTRRWKASKVHWTCWPYVVLKETPEDKKHEELIERCREVVKRLVKRYNLSDVEGRHGENFTRFNSNWYIVNGEPLIVDVGLADYMRS